jgi:hypothetical protein
MSRPLFGLRVALALLLLGGLTQGRAPAAGEKEDLDKLRKELKRLSGLVEEQQKELKTLRERIKTLEATGAAAPPFRLPFPPPGGLPPGVPGMAKGKVLKIDKDDKTKVTISLGKKDGVQVGHRLMAIRMKPNPRPVALIQITEVAEKQATGKVMSFPGIKGETTAEVDDEVMAMPGGGFGPGPGGPFPGGPGAIPGGPGPFPGGPGQIKAKVSKVDKDKKLVTLSVSGDTPFKVGQMVMAIRMGERPQRLGFLKVTEANAKQLVGELTAGRPGSEGGEVQVGDEVQLMPGPAGIAPDRPLPERVKQQPPA